MVTSKEKDNKSKIPVTPRNNETNELAEQVLKLKYAQQLEQNIKTTNTNLTQMNEDIRQEMSNIKSEINKSMVNIANEINYNSNSQFSKLESLLMFNRHTITTHAPIIQPNLNNPLFTPTKNSAVMGHDLYILSQIIQQPVLSNQTGTKDGRNTNNF